ncbi:NAD-dependent epimerase/dehydratase family protein [Algoriphagus lacus]|uniref:NAD-dependent epimerase/dehydratase family protein n=1 Tax=Algoriphagus lacus TaxID=2056311 RepID=A0A418PM84_9BACT|nr:NAD-dependent epimerase/dehydratase family protein [Algoriphagus lacus]RIW12257.1 NAD-dependent epimerase/dehydratase family protein [Algoriphagus lacus]
MKILITGGTGFLGKILVHELKKSHEVISLGRGSLNQISYDLSKEIPAIPQVDMIIHAAGKAHVIPKSEAQKKEFFEVNLAGTANLLKGISNVPRSLVFISTVAVYGLEKGEEIAENSPLLGETPYAKSKLEAENLVREWGVTNRVNILILRLPLIVGPNPPGNLGAMVSALKKGYYRRMGEGSARKSMVLAEDIAKALPDWMGLSGTYNLTDGIHPSMAQLDVALAGKLGKTVKTLPLWPLKTLAKIGDLIPGFPLNSYRLDKLSHSLTFSDQKAQVELKWSPRSVLENFDPSI